METLAPSRLAESWDNVGLLVGDRDSPAGRVLTCLTLTPDVADEAIRESADLVITHHPVLFRGAKRLTTDTAEGRMLLELVRGNVAVYSPHTAFDSAADGVNNGLAEAFGLVETASIRPIHTADDGTVVDGSGRHGRLPAPESLASFLARVKTALGIAAVQFVGEEDRMVETVAIACGAAGEYIDDALRLGCDAFVTGETRFHTCLQARTEGIALVLLGHYASERPALESLATRLSAEMPDLTAWPSRVERDPLRLA